jgi:hypothetical protein
MQAASPGLHSVEPGGPHVIGVLCQIRVPKLESVWGWCPGCPERWGVAEIRVLFLWLEMTGCPAALVAPVAD